MTAIPLEGPQPPFQVVERVSKQARSIRIEVRPDGEVRLIIPRFVPKRAAYEFLHSREEWIRLKLAELHLRSAAEPRRPPLLWDGTDTIPLHGVETPVEIVSARLTRPRVRFDDGAITIFCAQIARSYPAVLTKALRTALGELARHQARRLLDEEAARLGVDYHGLRIADQKSLWGSCTPRGDISLNWRLVLAPPEVFRYVVVHELCHRIRLDHSRQFWTLVMRQMPESSAWRAWLRQEGASLHTVLPRR
ncbi:M48 family metallopeptidase [Nevskia soli]|uniref:M48 family metallopeptidase n=1 Tax=Nevskia soli TaxID=418856 RepID=UPI0014708388|nr:SprT family zinc-dependent metalloprotease [Nevskia soli]